MNEMKDLQEDFLYWIIKYKLEFICNDDMWKYNDVKWWIEEFLGKEKQ